MSFLKCSPCVFVIGNEYEILACAESNGIFSVKVGDKEYYPANSGVLSSEKSFAKIRVPQAELNCARKYSVVFKETIDRKAYFSRIAEAQTEDFAFKPIEKTEGINICHLADVHHNYDLAEKVSEYFGDDTDLFVFNGDIVEVESEERYFDAIRLVGNASKGKFPVLFSRGNHDTRGKLAERYVEFFPSNAFDTYFTFEVGALTGVVLDCGEDKNDDFYSEEYEYPWVYGGVNRFHDFRKRELAWLKEQELPEGKIRFAISHICPVQSCSKKHEGGVFDIERECYSRVNAELERMGISFMLCGHIHECYVIHPGDGQSYLPHNYPVIVGSKLYKESFDGGKSFVRKYYGAAITVNKNEVLVKFVDTNLEIYGQQTIKIGN